jgi:hypothetical protein
MVACEQVCPCCFSKKWGNHESMLALAILHYNYCRVHGKLKTTPAVASGIETHRWTVREMLEKTAGFWAPKKLSTHR